jgi:hypothetical protein
MAEVTSGDLTVIVLDAAEARALTYLLTSHQRTGTPWQRFGVVAGLVEALTGPSDLCDECGLEPGDLDCGCRCECWHTCPM